MTADVIHVNHTRRLPKRTTKSHMYYNTPEEIDMAQRTRDGRYCLVNAIEYMSKETDVNSVGLMIASYEEDMIISLVGKLIDHNPSFINRVQTLKLYCLCCTEFFSHFQTLHPATKLSVLLDLFEYCTPRQLSETVHQNSCCDSYKGLASLIGLNVTLCIFLNIEYPYNSRNPYWVSTVFSY